MSKFSLFAWVLVVVVAAFMLYRVKYEVQSLRVQIADTSRELEAQREALHVVAAEWAYLNRPERLQALTDKYLSASSVTVSQIAEVEAIPYPKQSLAKANPDDNIRPASVQMNVAARTAR